MKIFISWSGDRSKAVAGLFKDWIKSVLQASNPWVSTQDIQSGSQWNVAINNQLSESHIGIICLTQENKNQPWILFEAGALARGIEANRVCTFLVDLQPRDLNSPLSQFNHTAPDESGIESLVRTINDNTPGESRLDDRLLDRVLKKNIPDFMSEFNDILQKHLPIASQPRRTAEEVLDEILLTTRRIAERQFEEKHLDSGVVVAEALTYVVDSLQKDPTTQPRIMIQRIQAFASRRGFDWSRDEAESFLNWGKAIVKKTE